MSDVTVNVYSKKPCVQCDQTKRHLTKREIPFTEQPLEGDNLDAAIELGFGSAPVVFVAYPDGTEHSWCGYRPDRIDEILKGMIHERQAS